MKRLLLILAALPALSFGQLVTCTTATIPVCTLPEVSGEQNVRAIAIPQSTTAVTSVDTQLSQITVNNTTAGTLTFTVADRQGSPIAVVGPISVGGTGTAGTPSAYVITFLKPYYCAGGFTIVASGAGLTFSANFSK